MVFEVIYKGFESDVLYPKVPFAALRALHQGVLSGNIEFLHITVALIDCSQCLFFRIL